MIRTPITITVHGLPKPKGSMVCTRTAWHGLREQVDSRDWQKRLNEQISKIRQRADPGQPIGVDLTVILRRPAGHYGTGKNKHRLRPSAPTVPVGHNSGDIDKHARQLLDALQRGDSGPLVDDCQVVELTARRIYAAGTVGPYRAPGVRVRIYPLLSDGTFA